MDIQEKILFVDDDFAISKSYTRHLTMEGYMVDTFDSIDSAIMALDTNQYSVAIIDMDYPKEPEGGIRIISYIKENKIDTILIILITKGSIYSFRKIITYIYDYIEKGDNVIEDLLKRVKNALELKQLERTKKIEIINKKKNLIERSITFTPEYQQAGMSILSYFNSVLMKEYPDIEASVTIKQEGLKVSMIIETPDGKKEEIEEMLNDYGLVVTGKKAPEHFTDDRVLIMELENQLTWTKAQIETKKRLLKYQDEELKRKDIQIERFMSTIEKVLQRPINIEVSPRIIQADNSKIADERGIIVEGKIKGDIRSGNERS